MHSDRTVKPTVGLEEVQIYGNGLWKACFKNTECWKNTAANLMEAYAWFEMRIYDKSFGKFYKPNFSPFVVFCFSSERFAEDH